MQELPVQRENETNVVVVIPCYKSRGVTPKVITQIPSFVKHIIVVDDCCPLKSADEVLETLKDPRIEVIKHSINRGVGAATVTGYKRALDFNADIVVKLDADGQMDPAFISCLIAPLIEGEADYVKGNRFFDLEHLIGMPYLRLIGNAILSFVNKVTSGYWNVMDPTNGFTAIHRSALQRLPLEKISERYFFESDMLFRLNIIRAVVVDVPMAAKYEGENSNLKISRVLFEFPPKFVGRFFKRILYNYFIRDFSVCSICILFGVVSLTFGVSFGWYVWEKGIEAGVPNSAGTVMIAALPCLFGLQCLLIAIVLDTLNVPNRVLSRLSRPSGRAQ